MTWPPLESTSDAVWAPMLVSQLTRRGVFARSFDSPRLVQRVGVWAQHESAADSPPLPQFTVELRDPADISQPARGFTGRIVISDVAAGGRCVDSGAAAFDLTPKHFTDRVAARALVDQLCNQLIERIAV
jgi:hypothetical protein